MKNRPEKLLIIVPNFFFSITNRPKTSPNLIFCSIKNISLRDFYIMTLAMTIQGLEIMMNLTFRCYGIIIMYHVFATIFS